MAMTRKDFIALADALRPISYDLGEESLDAIIKFLRSQNPKFNEAKWRAYLFR